MDNPTHPMSAQETRAYVQFLALSHSGTPTKPGAYLWGGCSLEQSKYVASWLGDFTGHNKAGKLKRLDLLTFLFNPPRDFRRIFESSKDCHFSEAGAVLTWLGSTTQENIAQEIERCLTAYRVESGQLTLEGV